MTNRKKSKRANKKSEQKESVPQVQSEESRSSAPEDEFIHEGARGAVIGGLLGGVGGAVLGGALGIAGGSYWDDEKK